MIHASVEVVDIGGLVEGAIVGVDLDLVLADEAANGRHLGDALDGGETVLEIPVLDGSQLGQIVPIAAYTLAGLASNAAVG